MTLSTYHGADAGGLECGEIIAVSPQLTLTSSADAIDYARVCVSLVCQLTASPPTTGWRHARYYPLSTTLADMQQALDRPLASGHQRHAMRHPSPGVHDTLALDSRTLLEYCQAITQLLMSGMLTTQGEAVFDGLLFDLIWRQALELGAHDSVHQPVTDREQR
ncbi:hypothetical protein [Pantoea sp. 1.19]|uniref:hypothetical protein n=1 Tax=Pantoea sp. 1.19 TaxID=1925589 RepID=UPI000948E10E|nr:hypothetical protein [Pantoea sp. 1.19]